MSVADSQCSHTVIRKGIKPAYGIILCQCVSGSAEQKVA